MSNSDSVRLKLISVGCVQVDFTAPPSDDFEKEAELGLLAVSDDWLSKGLGNFLIQNAEKYAKFRGCETMRLELLSPRDWNHKRKFHSIILNISIKYIYYNKT